MILEWRQTTADQKCMSLKNFIKRSRVPETALPYLIDHLGCLLVVLALWAHAHRQRSPPLYTILMMFRELEDAVPEELIRPSTLSTQRARSNLSLADQPP